MKYIRQLLIILSIALIGELLHAILPLPVPASIYGIVLLFACLCLKIIPVSAIKETSSFLIEIMPIMFVPVAAGLMESWGILKDAWLQYVVIVVITTVVVMGVAGRVTQAVIRFLGKGAKDDA